jgi:hypothetical protein
MAPGLLCTNTASEGTDVMKRTQLPATSSQPLLEWVLCRGREIVTCQLDQAGDQYRVSVLPHRTRDRLFVRLFDAGLSAFQRHAALVKELRDVGWTLVAYRR